MKFKLNILTYLCGRGEAATDDHHQGDHCPHHALALEPMPSVEIN